MPLVSVIIFVSIVVIAAMLIFPGYYRAMRWRWA
ncbi:MAG: hypothetical protein ACLTDF_09290 [Coprococcus sp.]